jgi:hypothetical protein
LRSGSFQKKLHQKHVATPTLYARRSLSAIATWDLDLNTCNVPTGTSGRGVRSGVRRIPGSTLGWLAHDQGDWSGTEHHQLYLNANCASIDVNTTTNTVCAGLSPSSARPLPRRSLESTPPASAVCNYRHKPCALRFPALSGHRRPPLHRVTQLVASRMQIPSLSGPSSVGHGASITTRSAVAAIVSFR